MAKYFVEAEFECKCGCGHNVKPILIDTLDVIRAELGCAITITSGARCPSHNDAVGGVPDSYHIRGLAADCVPADGDLNRLANIMRQFCPTANILIYYSSGFVHFDLGGAGRTVIMD
ncbi:D-Ala-D-Ala carboxypeptidase family metallohydrolase [uncultured Phascolarctobacterium sp.]|uniref:D-Ala-D-Ala carboxypeptidase family metallohydrolase n=1 Tax=uncultured Phascolarctobacterium sp. TaxID=512296 RepID=UPI0025F29781|nr:D-Ala-D-Ala carboxypeptidase family metallohydrolase [uncultured Phascolarctobacterium sp.]